MDLQPQTYRTSPKLATFVKGETIYSQGDAADPWFEVVEGVVRICRFGPDGRRDLTSFCYPGDVFGIERGAHGDAAEAVTSVKLLAWPYSTLTSGPAQMSEQVLHQALTTARSSVFLFGRRTAEERVAAFLLAICDRTGSAAVNLPMTRADIADHLGLTLHTVSRTISDLVRRGFINLQGPQHVDILNYRGLRRLAGEAEAEGDGRERHGENSESCVRNGSNELVLGTFGSSRPG